MLEPCQTKDVFVSVFVPTVIAEKHWLFRLGKILRMVKEKCIYHRLYVHRYNLRDCQRLMNIRLRIFTNMFQKVVEYVQEFTSSWNITTWAGGENISLFNIKKEIWDRIISVEKKLRNSDFTWTHGEEGTSSDFKLCIYLLFQFLQPNISRSHSN